MTTRLVSRTFSAPSAAVQAFGPAPVNLEQPPGRRHRGGRAGEQLGHRLGHGGEVAERRAELDGELGEAHEGAEVAGRVGRGLLGRDRRQVDAGRAAAADGHGGNHAGQGVGEHRAGEALDPRV